MESFANNHEKAIAIYDWFRSNPNRNYKKYKQDLVSSDIVEYEDVYDLSRDKSFSVDSIEKILRKI
jgi:hypothetical protein